MLATLASADQVVLRQALVSMSTKFISHDNGKANFNQQRINRRQLAARLADAATLDVAPHVTVDDAFLAAHTKAGIELVLSESGFAKWMGEQADGVKKYKALLAGSKSDLVKGVLAAGFDFVGYIPSGLIELRRQLVKGK